MPKALEYLFRTYMRIRRRKGGGFGLMPIEWPDIDAFAVPGANFPTMMSIAAWESEFKKPVVTSTQAAVWAMARQLGGERIQGFGRLLESMPSG